MTGPMKALAGNPAALIAFTRGRARWLAAKYKVRDERRAEVSRLMNSGECAGRHMVREMAERLGVSTSTIKADVVALVGYRQPKKRIPRRRNGQQPGNEIPDQIREVLDAE